MISSLFHALETWLVLALLCLVGLVIWKARHTIADGLKARVVSISREITEAEKVLEEAEAALVSAERASQENSRRIAALSAESSAQRAAMSEKNLLDLDVHIGHLREQIQARMVQAERKALSDLQRALIARVYDKLLTQTLPAAMTEAAQRQMFAEQLRQLEPDMVLKP